jgi:hypothetical protein
MRRPALGTLSHQFSQMIGEHHMLMFAQHPHLMTSRSFDTV